MAKDFKTLRRFWSKVEVRGLEECWEWKAGTTEDGYGKFWVSEDRRAGRAHRISYEMFHDMHLPEGQFVTHSCDNRVCVNPRHLSLGSPTSNMREKVERGRQAKGEDFDSSKLTKDDVVSIRKRYAQGGISQDDLADEYNVSQRLVSFIVRGEQWSHVGGPRKGA